jgi:ectoine hydroxylase-related dioxygenase (phytanoyl-CoA dioxygenase family)
LLSQLGLAAPLAGTLPILRIDRPGDTWHRTPAHQDWWFSLLSPNCVTCWFAISDLRPDMGLLEVVPGSHKGGLIPFCRNDNHNPFRPVEDYPDSAFQPVALPEDSMLVFSQYLLHRSGMNNSAQCRLSVQLRYNDIATMDRPDTTYTVQHPKHVLELQNRLLRPS